MITDACTGPAEPGLVASLLADTDCQVMGLVERGYAALSTAGTSTSTSLTAMMVMAVALFGYQLMLGRALAFADLTTLAIRLGVVILLASSWGAMQSAAYDTLARAPTRIAGELVTAIEAPAPLVSIQAALDKIEQASIGWRQRAGIASPLVGGPPTTAMALNSTAFLLTITTLGLLVVSRVVLALLLSITPVIAGFYLFDTTRGIFEGWLRALIAAALAPLGILTLAAVEMAIVMPLLDRILAQQTGGQYLEQSVTPLALVAIVFSIAMMAVLAALVSISRGVKFRAGTSRNSGNADLAERFNAIAPSHSRPQSAVDQTFHQPRVVRALELAQRRESNSPHAHPAASTMPGRMKTQSPAVRLALPTAARFEPAYRGITPLQPRLRNRASRAAKRRDK